MIFYEDIFKVNQRYECKGNSVCPVPPDTVLSIWFVCRIYGDKSISSNVRAKFVEWDTITHFMVESYPETYYPDTEEEAIERELSNLWDIDNTWSINNAFRSGWKAHKEYIKNKKE